MPGRAASVVHFAGMVAPDMRATTSGNLELLTRNKICRLHTGTLAGFDLPSNRNGTLRHRPGQSRC
jgi:hypothetical protein